MRHLNEIIKNRNSMQYNAIESFKMNVEFSFHPFETNISSEIQRTGIYSQNLS